MSWSEALQPGRLKQADIWHLEQRGWRHQCKPPPPDSVVPARLQRAKEGQWQQVARVTDFYRWVCPECRTTTYMRREGTVDMDLVRSLRGDLDD